jgi:pyruvate-ferredoxin/flavodoxin oxidoreductase
MGNPRQITTIDGNEAAAYVACKTNEVIAIYPITPSSPMSELADQWSSAGQPNLWGTAPLVQEMQAEGGAAGAIHGALQAGRFPQPLPPARVCCSCCPTCSRLRVS